MAKMGRTNRKSSDHYSKRAGYDGKSKRRGYKSMWNGSDGQPRKGARIGAAMFTADLQPGQRLHWRVDATSIHPSQQFHLPPPADRCAVCGDPGGVRAGSIESPLLHRGCARRLARRGMRADANRAAAQAQARDLEARAAARELKSVGAPSLTPWTAADVADLAGKAAPAAPVDRAS